MQILANEIHVWSTDLTLAPERRQSCFALLSPDEQHRAERLRSSVLQDRFIAARSTLRQLLGLYLNTAPHELVFNYSEHNKPSITHPTLPIEFNLAHSDHLGIFAFGLQHALGIDTELITDNDHEGVAKRFFSQEEIDAMHDLPDHQKLNGFYRIWSCKEALIKAVGKGLFVPLSTFSVSPDNNIHTVLLENETWRVVPLPIAPAFQTTLACHLDIKTVQWFRYTPPQYTLEKKFELELY